MITEDFTVLLIIVSTCIFHVELITYRKNKCWTYFWTTPKGQFYPQDFYPQREKKINSSWHGWDKHRLPSLLGSPLLILRPRTFYCANPPLSLSITPNWMVSKSYQYWFHYVFWIWPKPKSRSSLNNCQFHFEQLSYHYSSCFFPKISINCQCPSHATQAWASWQSSISWV